MSDRDLDVVVYGVTGFAGKLTAEHLANRAVGGARIAIAGRDRSKLERVREQLPEAAKDWPIVVADSSRPETLRELAERTAVVASTVGPYATFGMPLVAACSAAGTHYADLTGEALFVRAAIDAHHDEAVKTGARIVTGCGFDAVPSDMGVLELHRAAVDAGAGELTDTAMVVTEMRGGVSGGTFASISTQFGEMRKDRNTMKKVLDPYLLSPDRDAEPDRANSGWPKERDPSSIKHDPVTGRWLSPFIMSSYNTRIVRRSNAIMGHIYGSQFRYSEWLGLGSGLEGLGIAAATTAGTALLAGAMMLGPTRSLLASRMPKPGEGPSEQSRAKGRFRCELSSTTTSGRRVSGVVAAMRDPGYGGTAIMLGEAALALALDGDELPDAAGVLTPASAIGTPLADRLRANDFTLTATVT